MGSACLVIPRKNDQLVKMILFFVLVFCFVFVFWHQRLFFCWLILFVCERDGGKKTRIYDFMENPLQKTNKILFLFLCFFVHEPLTFWLYSLVGMDKFFGTLHCTYCCLLFVCLVVVVCCLLLLWSFTFGLYSWFTFWVPVH